MTYTRKKRRGADSGFHRLAVDFDGVLMDRGTFGGAFDPAICLGRPIDGAAEALEELARRFELVVFSSRVRTPEGRAAVERWLEAHNLAGFFADITADKINALAYIDDRAVRFETWAAVVKEFG